MKFLEGGVSASCQRCRSALSSRLVCIISFCCRDLYKHKYFDGWVLILHVVLAIVLITSTSFLLTPSGLRPSNPPKESFLATEGQERPGPARPCFGHGHWITKREDFVIYFLRFCPDLPITATRIESHARCLSVLLTGLRGTVISGLWDWRVWTLGNTESIGLTRRPDRIYESYDWRYKGRFIFHRGG
jgi:hypothetical protein